ncbi:hypothetical protein [Burkholderia ubonensis]|uniref:hypothetical protein n=1 Tax=Burkholderia ubonensis TaxID=101571 RepID=UPI0012F72323|nr:hypothetical protein [Burkholderia ubonensis]
MAILAIKNEASLVLFGNTFLPNGDFGVATGNGSAVWHILIDSNANDNPGLVAGDRLHLLNDFITAPAFWTPATTPVLAPVSCLTSRLHIFTIVMPVAEHGRSCEPEL